MPERTGLSSGCRRAILTNLPSSSRIFHSRRRASTSRPSCGMLPFTKSSIRILTPTSFPGPAPPFDMPHPTVSNKQKISASLDRREFRAQRTIGLVESVIREMTRLSLLHNAVNLSQGFPDFPAPSEVKEAAKQAIDADINQYAITWGAKRFRDAVARKTSRSVGWEVDPETEVTVVCGSTEAMFATFLGLLNPGDEVIIFEPFYENYGPDCALTGAVPRLVKLRPPDWSFSKDDLQSAVNERTR